MIAISYKNYTGFMNLETQSVSLECFKYNSIEEAIKNIDYDTETHKKELEIIDNLLGSVIVEED